MKKSKMFLRIISIILSILLIIEVLPMSVFAQELQSIESTNIDTESEEEATIIGEIESERTENTKHFRLSDGSFIAATYPEPVHYMVDGEWKEIDNTLVEKTIDGTDYYVNEKASNKVAFSQVLSDESVIIQDADGYEISLTTVSDKSNKSKGKKKDVEDLTSSKLMKEQAKADKKAEKMEAKNKKSGVKYNDVYSDTDIEYIVTPSTVKENIIVNKKTGKYVYDFNADFGKLVPKMETESIIGLYDTSKKATEPVILVEAPIMYDAAGETSTDVSISFKRNGDKYIVTVTADKEWINDKSREFPVVIDPTVKLDVSRADISDVYVDSENPNWSHKGRTTMLVGKNRLGTTRIYVKFKLPDLPDCSIVTGAALVLQQCGYDSVSGDSKFIYAYDCGSTAWESSTITWNNQPMNKTDLSSYTVLDYQKYRTNPSGRTEPYTFDITKAAKNWYENGVNNGIMLASSNESVTVRSEFCSSEYSTNSDYFPSVWVSYVNNTGIEDYWTYKTVDLGRSGAVYVGDYNGTFTYVHNDVATAGNRMPASVSHVYSSDQTNFGGHYCSFRVGLGFRLSFLEKVIMLDSSSSLYSAGYRLKHIDGDGTVHYYKSTPTTNQFAHEFNEKLTITKRSNNRYYMQDEEGNEKEFTAGGYLLKTTDSNSNSVTVTYIDNGSFVSEITDGAGKKITFEYDSDNYLSSMTDPAGRKTVFVYQYKNGVKTGYLDSIKYPDNKTTKFIYNETTKRLSEIISYDNSSLAVTFKNVVCKSKTFYRVATVTRNGQADANGNRTSENKLTLTYNTGETKVTDMYGKSNYIYFDHTGHTVNVRDHENNTSYAKYNTGGNKANTLAQQSNTFAPINNLLKNNSAELSGSEWYEQFSSSSVVGDASITTEQHYVGYKSFKVYSESSSGRVNLDQNLAITPGGTYTLSAYVKIPENMGAGTGGACLGYCYEDANGSWQIVYGEKINIQQDWTRESFTFTLPSDATGDIGVLLVILDRAGTAYFDCVQLEEGSTMNRNNLLDNSGFDYNASYWTYSAKGSSDGIVSSGINGKGLRLYGSPTADKKIYQNVQINGKSGDTVVFGAFAKANAAGQTNNTDDAAQTRFKATLTVYYTDGTKADADELFNADVSNAQYICSAYTLEKDCNYVTIELNYFDNVNSVIFDNACLYLDNYGSNYEYDEDGKLVAVENGTGQGISYTYDGPDLTKISQKFDGEEKESCTYTYDDNHNLLTETTKGGVVTEYSYTPQEGTTSTYGNPTKVTVKDSDGTLQSSCTMEYTADYNYLTKVTDSRNGTTIYNYDTVKGVLNSVTDANGNVTTYTYDPNTDALLSTTGQSSPNFNPVTNSYTYTNDRLTSITHNGFSYGFNYDEFGRVTSTSVAGQTLISHTYNANGTLGQSTYGNGDYVNYSYDSLDRVVSNSYNGIKTFEYDYNKEGLVARETDYENNVVKNYEYDFARRLVGESSSNGLRSSYTYDERNNIKNLYVTKGDVVLADNEYTYKEDGLVDSFTMPLIDNSVVSYTHDSLNRVTQEHIDIPMEGWGAEDADVFVEYSYISNGTNQTGLVSEIRYHTVHQQEDIIIDPFRYEWDVIALRYTYDANGNITTVSEVEYDDDGNEINVNLLHTYTYDGLNQLIRHDDAVANKSTLYNYNNGNYTGFQEYGYSTGTLGNIQYLKLKGYSSTWKDQMTYFDGERVTYDEIGNVTSYEGYTYDWEKGRQLSSITGNGLNMSFDYNSSGLRTKKIVNGEENQYFYSGDLLISEYNGLEYMNFTYSPSGEPVGFSFYDAEENEPLDYYFYFKNIQGDIIGLLDHQGAIYCTYSYDAWGKLLGVYDRNGNEITNPNHAANRNPLRYRGYYYDDETGLYYLNSRYYNPEWGTFICADDINCIGIDGTVLSYNLYSYCGNNPIVRQDTTGYAWETAFDVVSLVASAVEVTMNPTDLTAWVGLVGDTVDLIPFVTGVGETIKVLRTSSKLTDKIDGTIDTYRVLKKGNKGTGNEVHHIIEKRFADWLGIDNKNNMLSIVLDKETHRAYTSSWRGEIGYGIDYLASNKDIVQAAFNVYQNSPKLFGAVLYTLSQLM
ncbi:MAG: DNRLRE domain-containing protein [Clostridia bacterium]|nr:DNRLRE domain-containing protein [Clostridia bacterium]